MSTSSGGVLSESDLEAAKYPLKHNLCVDALAGGFFDAFVDLFRISHPEVTARDQPPAAPVEYLNPADRPGTLSDEQMVQLKQDLCNAEFYGRQGTTSGRYRRVACVGCVALRARVGLPVGVGARSALTSGVGPGAVVASVWCGCGGCRGCGDGGEHVRRDCGALRVAAAVR